MSNEEDEEQLPGEDELYDLWLEAGKSARVIADQIGLTDEDLAKIEKKWSTMGANGFYFGQKMFYLLQGT